MHGDLIGLSMLPWVFEAPLVLVAVYPLACTLVLISMGNRHYKTPKKFGLVLFSDMHQMRMLFCCWPRTRYNPEKERFCEAHDGWSRLDFSPPITRITHFY